MAIAFDSSAGAVSLTVTHNIAAAGNNRILIAFYAGSSASASGCQMASAAFNGVAHDGRISVYTVKWSNYYGITGFWWLESSLPSSGGNYNCVATPNSGVWNYAGMTNSFTGVAQSAPANNTNTSIAGSTGQSSVGITTTDADSMLVDAVGIWAGSALTATAASGQTKTQQRNQNAQGAAACGYEAVSTAQAYSQLWNFTASEYAWQAMVFGISPVGGAAPRYNMLGHNF